MGKEIRVRPEPGVNLVGTSHASWTVGNNREERIYFKASQRDFIPYLVFDPDTKAWYAIGSLEDEQNFAKGFLPKLGGSMDQFTLANRVFTKVEGLIFLVVGNQWGPNYLVGTMKVGAVAPYVVPSGKKFVMIGGYGNGISVGYCDSLPDVHTMDPAILPGLNPIYSLPILIAQVNGTPTPVLPTVSSNPDQSFLLDFTIPSGKTPFVLGGASQLIGYEVQV